MATWFNDSSSEIAFSRFDKLMMPTYRFTYLIIRITLGTILGKEKRNGSLFFQKLHKGNYVNPTFLAKIYLNRFLGIFKLNKSTAEIYIPKYDHKILCPLNEVDYISLVSREEDILQKFNPQEGDVVVDIGAHLGRYSIIGSKKVKFKGKVISIEANPNVFDLLSKNIKLNELKNVILLNCAAYSKKKKINFYLHKNANLVNNHYGTVMDGIDEFSNKGFNKVIEVEANTLDEILFENNIEKNTVRWLKIDVEGAEFEVLKGAKNLLSESTKLSILIEIHNLSKGNNYFKEINKYLKSHGFEMTFEERHDTGEAHVIFSKIQL
jgi:FkbM family methyltransferase